MARTAASLASSSLRLPLLMDDAAPLPPARAAFDAVDRDAAGLRHVHQYELGIVVGVVLPLADARHVALRRCRYGRRNVGLLPCLHNHLVNYRQLKQAVPDEGHGPLRHSASSVLDRWRT